MVRGTFFTLLCGLVLFWAAPLSHADGGAPATPAPSQDGSSGQGSTQATDGKVTNPYLFIDVPANHWAVEDLKYLVEFGVITGLPNGAFNGDKSLTRYEATAMIARAMRMMSNHPSEVTKADLNAFQ
ncbi:MAG TPA: S-layer homology domain-containing protein, partial [Candidatus Bipolaricaulota bacterium]